MHTRLIVLAGGASSRMKKQSSAEGLSEEEVEQANQRSKGLIGVGEGGRPLMDYLLYNAKKAGYRHIYIVINEQGKMFQEFYGDKTKDNVFHGLKISFAIQYIPSDRVKPWGTADAVYQAMDQFPELQTDSFSVCNCDNLYSVKALKSLREQDTTHAFIGYDLEGLGVSAQRAARFAVTQLDEQYHLLDIIEKPTLEELERYKDHTGKSRVSMNAFKFDGNVFYHYLKNCPVNPDRNEKELPTALLNMLKDYPNTMKAIPFSELVPDLTSKDDIPKVKAYIAEKYTTLEWD